MLLFLHPDIRTLHILQPFILSLKAEISRLDEFCQNANEELKAQMELKKLQSAYEELQVKIQTSESDWKGRMENLNSKQRSSDEINASQNSNIQHLQSKLVKLKSQLQLEE